MSERRLIEEWLPIAELGEESSRDRRSMTALPPTYYLHVWWARRPLVASRAAVLDSLLLAGTDREKFRHVLGIHGDPVAARSRIDRERARKMDARMQRGKRCRRRALGVPLPQQRPLSDAVPCEVRMMKLRMKVS